MLNGCNVPNSFRCPVVTIRGMYPGTGRVAFSAYCQSKNDSVILGRIMGRGLWSWEDRRNIIVLSVSNMPVRIMDLPTCGRSVEFQRPER